MITVLTHSETSPVVAARSGDPPDRRLYLQSRVSATDARRPLMLAKPKEAGDFEPINLSGIGLRRIAQSSAGANWKTSLASATTLIRPREGRGSKPRQHLFNRALEIDHCVRKFPSKIGDDS